jgi:hypothetical protein
LTPARHGSPALCSALRVDAIDAHRRLRRIRSGCAQKPHLLPLPIPLGQFRMAHPTCPHFANLNGCPDARVRQRFARHLPACLRIALRLACAWRGLKEQSRVPARARATSGHGSRSLRRCRAVAAGLAGRRSKCTRRTREVQSPDTEHGLISALSGIPCGTVSLRAEQSDPVGPCALGAKIQVGSRSCT